MKGESVKPEYMTSLSGRRLVSKTHGRIVFRGLVDTLEAEVIEAQVLTAELGEDRYRACLGEILEYLRALMAAEVKETPLPPPFLFGMDETALHRLSRAPEGNAPPLPSYTQGPLAARLNLLRTKIREAELCSVKVFGPRTPRRGGHGMEDGAETSPREDIILALNRLSGALWHLFCEYLSRS